MNIIGVLGGSGLYEIDGIEDIEYVDVDTPWGSPSDRLIKGTIDDLTFYFLPRHGRGHKISPSEINYRANIFALKKVGVEKIISVSAVGSMKGEIAPGHVVLASQFIDLTKRRDSTFFSDGLVAHISMADPVCPILSQALFNSSLEIGATVHMGGTYLCIEGPQFSTRAESELYRSWDVDVIGMTNMPEAKLAREAEMCYSTLAFSTDYDCWHDGFDDVNVEDILEILSMNVEMAKKIIKNVIPKISGSLSCACPSSLESAIITDKDQISEEIKEKLNILIKRFI